MRARTILGLTLAGCLLSAGLPAVSSGTEPATITDQKDEWQNVYGLLYYRVTGHVKNASDKPLKYVKFELQLLDKDGKSVAHQVGYNQKAQFLAEEPGEGETAAGGEKPEIQPLPPGDTDYFRVGVTKGDLPKKAHLASYCVKVVEAPFTDGTAAAADAKFTPQCVKFEQPKAGKDALNLNAATEDQLMKLPGMTTARAKAILVHRKGHGDFIQVRELQMIPQVTPIYDGIKGKLVLE